MTMDDIIAKPDLKQITGQLSLDEVLDSVVRSAVQLLKVDAAEAFLLNPDGQTFSRRVSDAVQPGPVNSGAPGAEHRLAERAIRSRKLVVIGDTKKDPDWQTGLRANGKPVRAAISVPLKLDEVIIGALNVYSAGPRDFTDEDQQILSIFAQSAALAVSSTRLLAGMALERQRLQTVLDTIPSGIIITEAPDMRVAFMNRRSQDFFGVPPEIGKPLPVYLSSNKLLHSDGSPFLQEELPIQRSMLNGDVVYGDELIIETPAGERYYLLLGSSPLYDESGNIYGAVASTEDITPLRRTQEALRQAYARERRVSETLQQALLPKVPGTLDRLQLASTYKAAVEEAQIGGDFFDIFSPAPGLVGIVVGDVAGKGVEAAVHTALTRHSLRAYSYIDPSPAFVIKALNSLIVREAIPESFITVFYGLLDIEEGLMHYVNAGHEPPLYLDSRNSGIVEIPNTGIPLGVTAETTYDQAFVRFAEGGRILLYTDGVTEARFEDEFFGMERLKEFTLSHAETPPADFVNRLMEHLQAFSRSRFTDDIAILLVEMGGPKSQDRD